jgi:protein phosphatase
MTSANDSNKASAPSQLLHLANFPPLSSRVQVDFGACSRRGPAHSINADHYMIIRQGRSQDTLMTSLPPGPIPNRFDEYGYGMAVADGFGTPETGEAASRLALVTLMQLVLHFGKWNLRVDDQIAKEILERAERFYRHVDVTLALENREGGTPLQTTITAMFGAGHDLFFAHVGHSRAYLFRAGQLMQLTHDHTIGRPSNGPLPFVDVNAAPRDLRHILTDTIGMGGATGPAIDLERFQLDDRDIVLVCTNGVTDILGDEVLADVLGSNRTPQAQSCSLVDLAMEGGGEDDATALVALYHVPE